MRALLAVVPLLALPGCASMSNLGLAARVYAQELRCSKAEARVAHLETIMKLRGDRLDELESDVFDLQVKEAKRSKTRAPIRKGKP